MLVHILAVAALATLIQGAPWEPVPKDSANWRNLHEQFVNNTRNQRDSINVLFYGDSITAGWNNAGKPVYDREYAPLGTANYGISGDRVEHVLWRVLNGEVEGLHPKVVVLKIGTNNGGNTADDVVIGITVLVTELRRLMPDAKILLLGILPRSDTEQWFEWLQDINVKISKLENRQDVFFLNMFNQFSVGWNRVDTTLFTSDKLHLVLAGYEKWAETMRPSFTRLLE